MFRFITNTTSKTRKQLTEKLGNLGLDIKEEFPKLSNKEDSIMSIKSLKNNIYQISIQGFDDTIGNLLQSYISTKMIDDKSILSICGYKRVHPLEETIIFKSL